MLKEKIILAPLAGCSDLAFRLIAREHSCKFAFYEMSDANALVHNNNPHKTLRMLQTHRKDKPIAAQILGGDPDRTLKASEILLSGCKPKFLDINAACPARKVIKKRAGAHLLREPKMLYKIIHTLSRSLTLPITVKIRTGYSTTDIKEITTIAKHCQKAGASILFVHGRTMKQQYSGVVDYKAIKAIKKAVDIPVYGSGDILTPQLAEKMLNETGCDGMLVARGALGNPWIFKNIENYLKGKKIKEPTFKDRIKVLKKHLAYLEKYMDYSTNSKIGHMRKVAIWYMRGLPQATELRRIIGATHSEKALISNTLRAMLLA
ncbi:MAG: tRNA dihydrouridine synthase DusB [Candidatus Margulisiibacteriota bacterium]|nr:tRNA dihydrouridine synthase DusB [Candidatus Margulisiibacteriota bacterium]